MYFSEPLESIVLLQKKVQKKKKSKKEFLRFDKKNYF